jgi:protease-4
MPENSNVLMRVLRALWRGIDAARKVFVNLLFLFIVVALLALVFRSDKPDIADTTALVIAPQGRLVEQLTAKSVDQLIDEAQGNAIPETLLKDVLDTIEAAKEDERIEVLVLDLSAFRGGRLTKLQDVVKALEDFRSSGKKVIARADVLEQDGYFLAAHADEIIIHKFGAVILQGFGRYRMYYKEGIDKLGLDVHVFKVGTYKSAVEPFLLDGMSGDAKEANREWLGDLWRIYLDEAAAARGMNAEQLDNYAQNFQPVIAEANGDTAKAALDFGLVDQTMTRIEIRQHLIDLVGEDEEKHTFNQVGMADYLRTIDDDRFGREAKGDKVAVIVARGSILDGSHPAGTIGGDSTGALIRKARNDEDVKAIILRVDSGGGSAFASEIIRRECEAARAAGIPVIASMGSVAASGGFWISTSSDQIWAHPSTITGSIGIFGMFATYQRPLAEHLGLRVDGISTAPIAGVRPDRELPEDVGEALQQMIEQGYRDFLARVAASRGMTTEEVDAVAQGRVWSGADAYELGLVDNLGDLDDAIAAVAELAGLGDDYAVSYIEQEPKLMERLLSDLMGSAVAAAPRPEPSRLDEQLSRLKAAVRELADFNDPNHVYAWSTIETD